MRITSFRGLLAATLTCVLACTAHSETIVKLNLGAAGPSQDIQFQAGVLSTISDGNGDVSSPGDQDSTTTFHGFVSGAPGILDIIPPMQASFSLSGVQVVGAPFVVNHGPFSLVTQPTQGGAFSLYDEYGEILLTGTLSDGSLNGATGASSTGGFLTANLGTFTGPNTGGLNKLFGLLQPSSASLAISLTDVRGPAGIGLTVVNNQLQDFTADATANIGAAAVPEPSTFGLGLACFIFLVGYGKRRSR